MDGGLRTIGKWLVVASIAGAGLVVEVAPMLGLGTKDAYARLAATLIAHSSCMATVYGNAQRIDGRLVHRDDAHDASCDSFDAL